MALKIVRAEDPIQVDRLNVVIYGPPGLGKTSLAFTADTPLLLDFDNGSYRAANRKDVVLVNDWRDVAEISAEDLAPYKTVIVDTAGRALDVLTADILRTNRKAQNGAGALSLQGYGELKSRFNAFMKRLNSFGKDVVLIAHMDEQRNGDETVERLDVQGGSKGEIYKVADAMGRMTIKEGKRWLHFSPTETAFGKNPGQLPSLDIPVHTSTAFASILAWVIAETKERLNSLSDGQRAAVAEQQWFSETLPNVKTVEGINALVSRASAAGQAAKEMLHHRAKELRLIFDREKKEYLATEETPAETNVLSSGLDQAWIDGITDSLAPDATEGQIADAIAEQLMKDFAGYKSLRGLEGCWHKRQVHIDRLAAAHPALWQDVSDAYALRERELKGEEAA